MKKLIILLLLILLIPKVYAYDYKDCEVFVLPKLGITEYQTCLQNPDAYKSYFKYHDVSFYDGTTLLKTSSVREGSDAIPPIAPSKYGYDFIGWDKSYTNIQSSKNIYANYDLKEYTVTFKDYNGTTLKTEYIKHGNDANPPSVSRNGYVFTGWSGNIQNIQQSVTLFAQYLRPEYEVVFYGFENEILKIVNVPHGSNANPPSAPNVDGFNFTGWIGTYTDITSDKSIYAGYEPITHTVSFVSEGSVIKEVEVVDGGNATPPNNPTKDGYTFIGWDKTYDNILANKTINALYQINSYQVVYHGLDKILKTEIVNYNDDSTPPSNYTEEGYDFLGWIGSYQNVDSNKDIYANYSKKSYTVVLKDYDGSTIDTVIVKHGESLVIDNPIRSGYDFIGWSDTTSNITKDMTLIARYEVKSYQVNYYLDNDLIKTESVRHGGNSLPPLANKEGYDFVGWDQSYENITNDLEINSIFEVKKYNVVLKDYNGSDIASLVVSHGENIVYDEPFREGYKFTGWSGSVDNITSNITLIAEYEIKMFLVDFYIDEELIESIEVNYNGTPTAPNVQIEGRKFIKWDTDISNVKSDLRANAIYVTSKYTVTFMNYDMTLLKSEIVEYGKSATPPAASKPGATFTNWSGSYNNIKSNTTLIAEFNEITFNVSFYDIDSNLIVTEIVKLMGNAKLPTPPTLSGYSFNYWDGNYENITKDEEVYAVYTESKKEEVKEKEDVKLSIYTIKFYDIDNSLYKEISVKENETIISPSLIDVKGYDFLGWDKELSNIKSDLIVNPIYKKKTFTVSFIDYDESTIKKEIVSYGDSVSNLEVSRKGYMFLGWDTDFKNVKSNLQVRAIYSPVLFNVQFVDINGEILKTEKIKYGESIDVTDPYHVGYTFLGWDKDINNVDKDLIVTAQYEIEDDYLNDDIAPTILEVTRAFNNINLLVYKDSTIDINYIQIDNEYYSNNDYTITSRSKGILSNKKVIEIVFNDIEIGNLEVISITDKVTNKEYLYDLRIENRELVNNILNEHNFKISTELSTLEKIIMWIKQLFN